MPNRSAFGQLKQSLDARSQAVKIDALSDRDVNAIIAALIEAAEPAAPEPVQSRALEPGYVRSLDPDYRKWEQDHARYARAWVDQWKPAVAAIRKARIEPSWIEALYDPHRDELSMCLEGRSVIFSVRELFVQSLSTVNKEWPVIEVGATQLRELAWQYRNYLPDYFQVLACKIRSQRLELHQHSGNHALSRFELHWVKHRDLACHLGCSGKPWYRSAARAKGAFTGPSISAVRRGGSKLYQLGPLLADFKRLAGPSPLPIPSPTQAFVEGLHPPDEAGRKKRSAQRSAQQRTKSAPTKRKVRRT